VQEQIEAAGVRPMDILDNEQQPLLIGDPL
jgi:hypothetical protein